jgi:hypothetical protein
MLLSKADSDVELSAFTAMDRTNIAKRMTSGAQAEVKGIIYERYLSAKSTTDAIALKMAEWEKQYKGEWQHPKNDDDERIFIPKTREHVDRIHAYLLSLIAQLTPVVTMQPKLANLVTPPRVQFERAKVMEALFNFYFIDVWKVRDDVLPKWLKHFLKFSQAIWKVSYLQDANGPDLKIDVVDRGLIYIDPNATELRHADWVIEKYYLTRAEASQRIADGYWYLPDGEVELISPASDTSTSSGTSALNRLFTSKWKTSKITIEEDERIEVWDYWQADSAGLSSVYAVQLGGEEGFLVRYGTNPFPYKGLPYRSKSYSDDDNSPDGEGMVEQETPFQKILNLYTNLRIEDVKKNIINPVMAMRMAIDPETEDDLQGGKKIVTMSAGAEAWLEANPTRKLEDMFFNLPVNTSTQELITMDLPAIMTMNKEASNVSDVFAGQAPPHQATLGQVQEQLSQNQGVLRPIWMQVMRGLEEVAEICVEYFKDPEFFPEERVIQIVGENKYNKVVENWETLGDSNSSFRTVSPDEMDVDVMISAVNQADALASKTFLSSSLNQFFQSVGQLPDMAGTIAEHINIPAILEAMLQISGHDINTLTYTEEEKKERTQQQQQQQQQQSQQQIEMLQMQLKLQTDQQVDLEEAKGQIKMMVETAKQQLAGAIASAHEEEKSANAMEETEQKVSLETVAGITMMEKEQKLEAKGGQDLGHGNDIAAKEEDSSRPDKGEK